MMLRGLRLATQFLTRVPVPAIKDYSPAELSRAAVWFPLVGLGIGVAAALIVLLTRPYGGALVAATLGLVGWVWLTGALHLDGLADLTDALAASHRDPEKFLTVLADPHVGAFGVVSVVLVLIVKTAALTHVSSSALLGLPLVTAWGRLGTLGWSRWLKPIKPGQGERFAWHLHSGWIALWTIVLLAASAAAAPILCIAPLVIVLYGVWLSLRLGGITGDCLGAGVELTEVVLLIALSASAPHNHG